MSNAVWIPKAKWDTLWAALHNVVIRQDFTVKSPAAGISGVGSSARLRISLPASVPPPPYTGTFEVTIENGLLNVDEGWLNRNGEWLTIPKVTGVAPETGWLCVCSTIENGDWTVPELRIETPSADAFPIAEIEVENDSITVRQLPVAVAMIILAKVCPMAEF